ncbi:2-phospho-L-lactate guanylyltransferase [Pseudovibrio sp. Tun.PSC04-5.I4]|uniref:2-phospho-L-lactate guanylyltransferase n=1 Tax=Pseudovibrio sp. Tun.PSC04-5.I4 TaxID=1798213 RepID=UPI000884FD93|nr:2-phospho-L-lactate guanylyltransferase [Pseudovibrio sp. Tun.PSC04-5.I4]SDQ96433.1 2-phospho-L-lactate guanylyltransferase [Pseudovibrio sp. Tun.PSC04-5.I4]
MTDATSQTLVVVPMKDLSRAKTRLSDHLDSNQRAEVAAELFVQTLTFLMAAQQQSGVPFDIAVVTSSVDIAEYVNTQGLHLIFEGFETGLNEALSFAASWAIERSYTTLCVLPADIAAPDISEFDRLLGLRPSAKSVVLCPALDYGTNVLIATPPDAIEFTYGSNSFLKHQTQAAARNIDCVIAPSSPFSKDVDRMEDLTQHLPQLLEKISDRRAV